jgi:hypothetical protein
MTISIDLAAPRHEITLQRKHLPAHGGPHKDNGESELVAWLGPDWCYEWWQYPLESCHPFTPDFWRPAIGNQPELHVELTWLDWAIARNESRMADTGNHSRRARSRQEELLQEHCLLAERWDRKRLKVDETNRLYGPRYGLEVILVTRELSETLTDSTTVLADLLAIAA